MRLETLLGAGVGLLLRAVYMQWVFAPYPAARYVDTAPLVVLGALAAAVLMELILQLFSRKRRRTRLRERAFGVSMFFSAAIFIEFGKMAGEYSGGAQTAVWAAAFASSLLLSNLMTRYCRYERLSSRRAVRVISRSARRPVQIKAKSARRAAQIKAKARSARRSVQAKAKSARRPMKSKVAPRPSWQYNPRGNLLYRGWNHRSTRRRNSAASRKRAYAYGRRQPARAV